MVDVKLKDISEINERMKLVLNESKHLYRVSLNALFASRQINVGIDGFIEVTGLLRDFSSRLDQHVNHLASNVTEAIYCVATLSKVRNMIRLIEKAFNNISHRYPTLHIESQRTQLFNESERLVLVIISEIERCLMLMGVGENLTVLAKVEASGVPSQAGDLDTITYDMEKIIVNINLHILEARHEVSIY